MNDFKAKYLQISSKYLDDKLNTVKVKEKGIYKLEDPKKSSIKKFVNSIFHSKG